MKMEWLFTTFAGCVLCGREDTLSVETGFCQDCFETLPFAEETDATLYYQGATEHLIQDLKYNNKRYLADIFARLSKPKTDKLTYDVITFVPSYNKKRRGYNQGELIARAINKDKTAKLLKKIKDTPSQTALGAKERVKNVVGCFAVTDGALVTGKKILLVDDVYTTGSTLKECKKELLKGGAQEVYTYTVCKTKSI